MFFQVRKTIRCRESYLNFLRCITLYNDEVISRSELLQISLPFLQNHPHLCRWFEDFVNGSSIGPAIVSNNNNNNEVVLSSKQERMAEREMEIDLNSSKRIGASYCSVPPHWANMVCSGKTPLCDEVLNNHWVSFPSWSEDATFVSSRKTQFEEYIYRCEDERFELDVVLETNSSTWRVLDAVHKKMQRMSQEEIARFRLDDNLGGTSATIHQRAIRRIYGDKAPDIIDGLKKNPNVAVPLVLRRLKLKEEEWREAQKNFNKLWREQNEKYYYKSLDHQGINFKQNDVKMLRSKSLLNDIETLFDERHEQAEESGCGDVPTGPHMTLHYPPEKSILADASSLIIHHVKRQTTIHKEDKAKIKQLMRHFIPDLLFHARQELSDDEKDIEDDDDEEDEDMDLDKSGDKDEPISIRPTRECKQQSSCSSSTDNGSDSGNSGNKRKTRSAKTSQEISKPNSSNNSKNSKDSSKEKGEDSSGNNNNNNDDKMKDERSKQTVNGVVEGERLAIKEEDIKMEVDDIESSSVGGNYTSDDEYRLFMCNNSWYLFLRLHQLLCHRLYTLFQQSENLAKQEASEKNHRSNNVSLMLRLKPKCEIPVAACYPAVLEMVRNLLDGHLDYNTYEDTLRETFTIHAYPAFTLDKVVSGAVRQLQHLVCDEIPSQCTGLFLQEGRRGGSGGTVASAPLRAPLEHSYSRNIEKLLNEENCFKIYSYKRSGSITIELVDNEIEETEENQSNKKDENESDVKPKVEDENLWSKSVVYPGLPAAVADAQKWSEYVDQYLNADVSLSSLPHKKFVKAVFLMRNLNSWRSLFYKNGRNPSSNEMHIEDNTQCKINLNTYKAVFVVNSESCLYKKQALQRARKCHKKVSHMKRANFEKFHNKWMDKNVKDNNKKSTDDWFMGRCEGLKSNKTVLQPIHATERAPFRIYNHYTYTMLDGSSNATSSTTSTITASSSTVSNTSSATTATTTSVNSSS